MVDAKDRKMIIKLDLYLSTTTIRDVPFLIDTGAQNTIIKRKVLLDNYVKNNEIVSFKQCCASDKRLSGIIQKLSSDCVTPSTLSKDDIAYLVHNYKKYCLYGVNHVLSFADLLDIPAIVFKKLSVQNVQVLVFPDITYSILGMDIMKYLDIHLNYGEKLCDFKVNENWRDLRAPGDTITEINFEENTEIVHPFFN